MTARRLAVMVVWAGCATDPTPIDQGPPCVPPAASTAPTYADLYAQYFAPGQPGHCANAGCHNDPGHNEWLCGPDKDSCYAGMVSIQLFDPVHGDRSMIGDPKLSPLTWINPTGNMPFDAQGAFPAGRDAILAWVAECARND